MCLSAYALGGQRLRSLGAGVTESFVFLRWVLGRKHESPKGAANTLNYGDLSPGARIQLSLVNVAPVRPTECQQLPNNVSLWVAQIG